MGKTKTPRKSGHGKDILHGTNNPLVKAKSKNPFAHKSTEDLLTEAATLLEQSQPELALPLAEEALRRLEEERDDYANIDNLLRLAAEGKATFPEALVVGADINLALGFGDAAQIQFLRATRLDPDGALVSAEPWLWLSQLCEEGGKQSIYYFEKATEVLRNEIELLEDAEGPDQNVEILEQKRSKLADALCGMAEIYMTDLSWEPDCETRCEQLVTEAVAICPPQLSAGALQVFASVRISQDRISEARNALASSMTIWKDLPPEIEDPARPDFATRVSLARLLMDVEAEAEAQFVTEGLIQEDDQSIEALYLHGWCRALLSAKPDVLSEDKTKHQELARASFLKCLKLYQQQGYEDTKLRDHAKDLLEELNQALGIEDDGDEEWEDADDDDEDGEADDADGGNDIQINGLVEHDGDDVEMT